MDFRAVVERNIFQYSTRWIFIQSSKAFIENEFSNYYVNYWGFTRARFHCRCHPKDFKVLPFARSSHWFCSSCGCSCRLCFAQYLFYGFIQIDFSPFLHLLLISDHLMPTLVSYMTQFNVTILKTSCCCCCFKLCSIIVLLFGNCSESTFHTLYAEGEKTTNMKWMQTILPIQDTYTLIKMVIYFVNTRMVAPMKHGSVDGTKDKKINFSIEQRPNQINLPGLIIAFSGSLYLIGSIENGRLSDFSEKHTSK